MKLTETDFSSYKAELTSAQQQTADSVQSFSLGKDSTLYFF